MLGLHACGPLLATLAICWQFAVPNENMHAAVVAYEASSRNKNKGRSRHQQRAMHSASSLSVTGFITWNERGVWDPYEIWGLAGYSNLLLSQPSSKGNILENIQMNIEPCSFVNMDIVYYLDMVLNW